MDTPGELGAPGAAELELGGRSLDYYNQELLFPIFCGFPMKKLAQVPKFGWRVTQDVNAVLGTSFCWGLLGLMVSLYWATSAVLGHGGIHSPAGIEPSTQDAPAASSLYPCPLWHWDFPREGCEGPVLNLSHSQESPEIAGNCCCCSWNAETGRDGDSGLTLQDQISV